jgi:lysophospholipase L1-like esterase
MKQLIPLLIASALLAGQAHADSGALPLRVILVGDSTIATRSGYGDALCARFTPETSCVNLARGGRSSGSFRAEGRWQEVQALLKDGAAYRASYVLIQFGHNDQPGKAERSTDLVTEFPANMARYASEVKALGGIPVLVTPLTRRTFKGPNLKDDLAPWAAAIRRVALEQQVLLLDLNRISAAAVQKMGQEDADTLAMAPPPPATPPVVSGAAVEPQGAAKSQFDRTHVGSKGAALFSGMVVRELVRLAPPMAPSVRDSK